MKSYTLRPDTFTLNFNLLFLSGTPGYRCNGSGERTACPAGYFSGSGSVVCTLCGSDSKYSVVGTSTCLSCPPGSRTSGGSITTRSACTSCAAGFSCDGTSAQTKCPKGKYSPGGAASCLACGNDNHYSDADGAASCATCGSGSYTTGGGSTTHTGCATCIAGFMCPSGDSVPQSCPAGRKSTAGSAACVDCGFDNMHSKAGAASCSTCTAGSITSGGAADGKTRTTCSPCPVGLSCDGTSGSAVCGAGQYSPEGSDSCLNCGSDSLFSSAGAKECTMCGAGLYTSGGTGPSDRQSCSQCPAGMACDGSSTATPCQAGKFSLAGSHACTSCGGDAQYSAAGSSKCRYEEKKRGENIIVYSHVLLSCFTLPWVG